MCRSTLRHERATIAVLSAFLLTIILGFAALAIDMSWLVSSRDQLQAGVDNTAISAAHYIANRAPFPHSDAERSTLSGLAITYGVNFMHENPVELQALYGSNVQTGNAKTGNQLWSGGKVTSFTPSASNFNAIRVTTTMSGSNPELPSFFGGIFGVDSYQPTATAIALLKAKPGGLIPFTLHKDLWDAYLAYPIGTQTPNVAGEGTITSVDTWTWNASSETATSGVGDGVPEVNLYPHVGGPCAGNFGTLNVGLGNQGTPQISAQIANGITGQNMEDELTSDGWGGPWDPVIDTYPWPYPPIIETHLFGLATNDTMGITGNPGMSTGTPMKDALDLRKDTIVGIFLHTSCTGGGSGATYTISEIRFARLLGYRFTGSPGSRYLKIQPCLPPTPEQLYGYYKVLGLGK